MSLDTESSFLNQSNLKQQLKDEEKEDEDEYNELDQQMLNFINFVNNKDKTIITISHRNEALKFCNKVIEVKNASVNEIKLNNLNEKDN